MDIDIDFKDRAQILQFIKHTPASQRKGEVWSKHPSGVYVTEIPENPLTGFSSIDYEEAEKRGYFKIDFLNVGVYQLVKSEQHLQELMDSPVPWQRLTEKSFVETVIHIGNHYDLLQSMPEPITDIMTMAQFLAIIRPTKRHLAGKTWQEVAKTVWDKDEKDGYVFKKSHATAYAQLVAIHMVLLDQQPNLFS